MTRRKGYHRGFAVAIDWRSVRADYESGTLTLKGLVKRYGCDSKAIKKRVEREGWIVSKNVRKGRGNPKDRRPGEKTQKEKGLKARARTPAALDADDHRSLWRGVKKRLLRGLQSRDLKQGLEELKVAKAAGEVLTSVIKGEREACGLGAGVGGEGPEDGVTADDAKETAGEMASLTVPPGADEAVEGE